MNLANFQLSKENVFKDEILPSDEGSFCPRGL